MKPPTSILSIAAIVLAGSIASSHAQNATTDPVGFVTVNITAGTGSAKKNTLFSPPLLEAQNITGQAVGIITSFTSSSISNVNAGWAVGELSNPSAPFLLQITSGSAEGRMFLIASSANTGGAIAGAANAATTVTISSTDSAQVDLSNLGIVAGTDTYRILACDTLSSLFGSPETTGVLGGATTSTADSITIVVNGSASSYFYKTNATPARWSRQIVGSPDASNVPILPYYGVSYSRLAASSMSLTITGNVPTDNRQTSVKNSGNTILSQFWPTDSTLSTSGLSSVVAAGLTASVADTVTLISGGSAATYFYDGTNWKRQIVGSPISNTVPIPVGTAVQLFRRGSAAGYSTLSQSVPYNL